MLTAVSIISLFLLVGCASFKTKDFSKYSEGSWQAKALIKDKKKRKSGIVNIKIYAVADKKMRLDVTSPIGTHLASVVMIDDKVEYLSIQEKTLYNMNASQETLMRVLKVPLDTRALYSVLFDKGLTDKDWSCVRRPDDLPDSCKNQRSKVDIEWRREGAKRIIEISSSSVSVQMSLSNFDSKINDSEKVFKLKVPSSFQVKAL